MPSKHLSAFKAALATRPDRLDALARGATEKAIEAFQTKVKAKLPASFYDLHRFRDGQEVFRAKKA